MEYKDFLGNDIMVGSTVVYPGRAMSSLWMNKGTVESLGVVEYGYKNYAPSIKVKRVADGWRGGAKSVWIKCLNRVVVVGYGV